MNSGQSAGISPYDCPVVIINIFIIDNKLSIFWNKKPNRSFNLVALLELREDGAGK
jgi:hypothetical protein